MKRYKLVTITLIVFLFLSCPIVGAITTQEIAEKTFPSVVLLMLEDRRGQPLSLASGFFVREDIVATNLHALEGAYSGKAKIVGQESEHNISGIAAIDEEMDLALLKVENISAPTLELTNSSNLSVGEEIFVVGNPMGLEGTFSEGIISGIREFDDYSLLQLTAPISTGSSGGPVLNKESEVIGIAFAAIQEGQNLNFAIPSEYLVKLLNQGNVNEIKSLEDEVTQDIETRTLNEAGELPTDNVVGRQFLWDSVGFYSFSLHNQLNQNIENVSVLVIFYDKEGVAIDVDLIEYEDVIPAGLSKRVNSNVDRSVQDLTTPLGADKPETEVEFRVLYFDIVN